MSGVKGAGSRKRMGGCLCRGHERVREGGADEEGSGKGGGARLARLPAGAVQKNGSGRGRQSVGGGEEPLLSRAALGHLRSRLRMPGPCPTRVHWRGRRQGTRSLRPLQRPPAPQWVQTVGTPSRPGPRQKSGTRNNYTHIRAACPEPSTVREAVEARYGSEPASHAPRACVEAAFAFVSSRSLQGPTARQPQRRGEFTTDCRPSIVVPRAINLESVWRPSSPPHVPLWPAAFPIRLPHARRLGAATASVPACASSRESNPTPHMRNTRGCSNCPTAPTAPRVEPPSEGRGPPSPAPLAPAPPAYTQPSPVPASITDSEAVDTHLGGPGERQGQRSGSQQHPSTRPWLPDSG